MVNRVMTQWWRPTRRSDNKLLFVAIALYPEETSHLPWSGNITGLANITNAKAKNGSSQLVHEFHHM